MPDRSARSGSNRRAPNCRETRTPSSRGTGANLTDRVHLVDRREDVFRLAVRLEGFEHLGMKPVRHEAGGEPDVAVAVGGSRADVTAGTKDAEQLRGDLGGLLDVLERPVADDHVERFIRERSGPSRSSTICSSEAGWA